MMQLKHIVDYVDQLPWGATLPVPREITLSLPAWSQLLELMTVGLFFVHTLVLCLAIGGLILTVFFECLGLKWKRYDVLAQKIAATVTVTKNLAVVTAIGPLLCISVLYPSQFFSANSLTGVAWFALAPLVSIAFLLIYWHRFSWSRVTVENKPRHIAIGIFAALLGLFVPLILIANINLMLFPDKWVQVQGFFSALQVGNVFPKYFLFICASLTLTGLFLAGWFGRSRQSINSDLEEFEGTSLPKMFYHICLWSTVLQFIFGPLLLLTLPKVGLTNGLYILFTLGFGFELIKVYLLTQEVSSDDEKVGRFYLPIVMLMLLAVICITAGLHNYRENSLALHKQLIHTRTQEFRGLEIAAKMRMDAGMGAGVALTDAPTGRSIFKDNCMACHAYDKVLAAPSILDVYETYEGNPEGIVKWAKAPGKKREEFGQMPAFDYLGDDKLRLVADFLLSIGSGEESMDEGAAIGDDEEGMPTDGAGLFQAFCTACHSIGQGKKIGPDLMGVTERRERAWLKKMIQKPSEMLATDPIAMKLLEEYQVEMMDMDLTDEQVEALIKYLENPAAATPAASSAAGTTSAASQSAKREIVLTPFERGRNYFQGTTRLQNRGPSCVSCHSIAYPGVTSGGNLGPDLTHAVTRLGSDQVTNIIKDMPYAIKKDAYKKHELTDKEIKSIVTFLETTNDQSQSVRGMNYTGRLLYSGLLGAILLLGIYSCVWYKRKEEAKK